MLKEERHHKIRRFIEGHGQATVSDLAAQFGVSEMTIRRDLCDLAAQGRVVRVHGGAIAPGQQRAPGGLPVLERMREEPTAKQSIGRAVADMVSPGETIFIGAGTTTLAVAESLIDHQGITVVTNALTVANSLAASPSITVLVVGGFLQTSNLSMVGHVAEYALRDLRVDKIITGMRGIHPTYGLTSDSLQMMMTDRAIMTISDTIIVVADHTKFGHVAASRTAPITAASLIVTDQQAPQEMLEEIRRLGVRIIQV